jgi:glutamyl-tRNA synthetase
VTSGCYQNCSTLSLEESLDRAVDKQQAFTVRLKRLTNVLKHTYKDLVYGKITPLKRTFTAIESEDGETGIDAADTILMKSDGTPTYHFANVVDDHLMEITHVIRGAEWIASTPLHYDLYSAFGWSPPTFAHVGLLVDQNKAKLSKRNADLALDVQSMREQHGVLPETLNNFLALLGWSNPLRDDVYTMDKLIENFDLKFTKGNAMVRFEKLWFLQKKHVLERCRDYGATRTPGEVGPKDGSSTPIDPILQSIMREIRTRLPEIVNDEAKDKQTKQLATNVLLADRRSYANARQFLDRNAYFFSFHLEKVPVASEYYEIKIGDEMYRCSSKAVKDSVRDLTQRLQTVGLWEQLNIDVELLVSADELERHVEQLVEGEKAEALAQKTNSRAVSDAASKRKKAAQAALHKCLREKLCYGLPGPNVATIMVLLGRDECARRFDVST